MIRRAASRRYFHISRFLVFLSDVKVASMWKHSETWQSANKRPGQALKSTDATCWRVVPIVSETRDSGYSVNITMKESGHLLSVRTICWMIVERDWWIAWSQRKQMEWRLHKRPQNRSWSGVTGLCTCCYKAKLVLSIVKVYKAYRICLKLCSKFVTKGTSVNYLPKYTKKNIYIYSTPWLQCGLY